mgnify:CR=1 FL=1
MKEPTYHLQITGKVQGVYYRKSTQAEARKLELKGWVKNEADGSVSAEVQGDKGKVQEFIAWCRQGPPGARVDQVKLTELEKPPFHSFEIIR